MKKPFPKVLERVAAACGVQVRYKGLDGKMHTASPDAVLAILESLGALEGGLSGAEKRLRDRRADALSRLIDPVAVVTSGRRAFLRLIVPEKLAGRRIRYELAMESGEGRKGWIETSAASPGETESLGKEAFHRVRVALPGDVPPGYHTIELEAAGRTGRSRLIGAPEKAFVHPAGGDGPQVGLFAPLYGLGGSGAFPSGDFGSFEAFVKFVAYNGGRIASTLPLHAAFLAENDSPSPYSPVSRRFLNEFYVAVEALPEFDRSTDARSFLDGEETREALKRLATEEFVDYRTAMAVKREVLERLAREIDLGPEARRNAMETFLRATPDLEAYAEFRAVTERQGAGWRQWPAPLRGGEVTPADYDPEAARYHLYAQFVAHEQLAHVRRKAEELNVRLNLDHPLGVHPDGFDTWRRPDLYVQGVSVGAPPDEFFAAGQDWGFPPMSPEGMLADGLEHFRATLSSSMAYADVLRIDHIMGLHRLFWVPSGLKPTEGAYVGYPADALYAVLRLESHRHRTALVGEDLGTVPRAVRRAMDSNGVSRMWVMQFEAGSSTGRPSESVPQGSLAELGTHDLPSFAAFWRGLDLAERQELGLLRDGDYEAGTAGRKAMRDNVRERLDIGTGGDPGREVHEVLCRLFDDLRTSRAGYLVASLEDLWGETRQQNWPGVGEARPSWRRKLHMGLREAGANAAVQRALRHLTGRAGDGAPDPGPPVGREPQKGFSLKEEHGHRPDASELELTGEDLFLFNEGSHFRLYRKLGAHCCARDGVQGTHFAVWAPNARSVHVVGDFNGWNRTADPLEAKGSSGIWTGFVPDAHEGHRYKYRIASSDNGYTVEKADPFAFSAELPPKTASVIRDLAHAWKDAAWMSERGRKQGLDSPMSIYEVHMGSWMRVPEDGNRMLSYRELGGRLAAYAKEMGFTHVEFLPVMEHPFYGSWGYQCTGFFAPTSRYGSPADFMAMVDVLHRNGVGVILDWVPSHFPTDEHGLAYFDGTHLYEHADPRQGLHPEWKSAIFNYGRNEVRSFLVSSALFWLDAYHADGLRVDGVASMLYLDYAREDGQWIPNRFGGRENLEAVDFVRRLNAEVYQAYPDVQTIAEESTSWPMVSRPIYVGGLGFGLKWDMGWMHDTLEYFRHDPVHRRFHQNQLTFRAMYAGFENFVLSLSHDEVVYGKGSLLNKMPGDEWQRFANLRLLLAYMYAQTGKKLLFMGCEFGQRQEWSHERSLDWHLLDSPMHRGVRLAVQRLNWLYRNEPALHERDCEDGGFEWIDCNDAENSILVFERRGRKREDRMVVACNFTPVPRLAYKVGADVDGRWLEVFNGDAPEYGGSGMGNLGAVTATSESRHGRPFSLQLTLPPLAAVFLRPEGGS